MSPQQAHWRRMQICHACSEVFTCRDTAYLFPASLPPPQKINKKPKQPFGEKNQQNQSLNKTRPLNLGAVKSLHKLGRAGRQQRARECSLPSGGFHLGTCLRQQEQCLIFPVHPPLLCSFFKWKCFEADTVLVQLWAELPALDRSDAVGAGVSVWSFPGGSHVAPEHRGAHTVLSAAGTR